MKGKTNTNGYPFEGVNHLLSIRHLFERPILLFTVTNLKKISPGHREVRK